MTLPGKNIKGVMTPSFRIPVPMILIVTFLWFIVWNETTLAEKTPAEIYRGTSKSVVLLVSYNKGERTRSKGTGFFIQERHVLTNAHVILASNGKPYEKIWIFLRPENMNDEASHSLKNGQQAKVMRFHKDLDLALLSVEKKLKIKPIGLGNSKKVSIGDPVLAIGHPESGGLWSLTSGRIGSVLHDFSQIQGKHVFQTEASLNRGNSGGPLLNYHGQMIGVNTSIARRSADGLAITGINFAVQSRVAQKWLGSVGLDLPIHPIPKQLPSPSSLPKNPPQIAQPESHSTKAANPKPQPLKTPVAPKHPSKQQPLSSSKTRQDKISSPPKGKNQILTPKRPFKDKDLFDAFMEEYEKAFDQKMEDRFKSLDKTMDKTFNSF